MIWVECDESGQPIKTTYVPARGDVPEGGNNLLPWKQDLQVSSCALISANFIIKVIITMTLNYPTIIKVPLNSL